MKTHKIITLIACVALLSSSSLASAQLTKGLSGITKAAGSILTSGNGQSAGLALLSLYTQYKSTGSLNLSDASTIKNVVTLITNIKGIKKEDTSNKPFLTGLISGSDSLVNNDNASSVIGTLASLSGLDTNAIAGAAASSAASSLLSKATGKSTQSNTAASTATSLLTGLFSTLK